MIITQMLNTNAHRLPLNYRALGKIAEFIEIDEVDDIVSLILMSNHL